MRILHLLLVTNFRGLLCIHDCLLKCLNFRVFGMITWSSDFLLLLILIRGIPSLSLFLFLRWHYLIGLLNWLVELLNLELEHGLSIIGLYCLQLLLLLLDHLIRLTRILISLLRISLIQHTWDWNSHSLGCERVVACRVWIGILCDWRIIVVIWIVLKHPVIR